MKKLLPLFLICYVCALACGCGKTPPPAPSVAPSQAPSQTPSVAVSPSVAPSQAPEKSTGLDYTLNQEGTGYILSGIGTCLDGVIVLPETYQGLPVIAVGDSAFTSNQTITKIIFNEGLTYIGKYAFMDCTALTEVLFPSTLAEIDSYAFANCPLTAATFTGPTQWRAWDTVGGGLWTEWKYVTNPQTNAVDLSGFYCQHHWYCVR